MIDLWSRLRRKGPSTANLRDTALVTGAKTLNGTATLGLNLLIVRSLVPADYGVFSVCAAVLTLFDALLGAALDLSVLRVAPAVRTSDGLTRAERAAVRIKIALVVMLLAAALVAGEWLGHRVLKTSGGRVLALVLVTGAGGLLLFRSLQVHFQRQMRFGKYALTDLALSFWRVALVLAAISNGSGSALTLLACYAAAPLLAMLVFSTSLWRHPAPEDNPASVSDWDLLKYTGAAFLAIASSSIAGRLDLLILPAGANAHETGLFGAAVAMAMIPEMLGSYMAPVFTPRIIEYDRRGSFLRFFRDLQCLLALVSVGALAVALLLAGYIVPRVLPPVYSASLRVLRILLLGAFAGFLVFPVTLSFLVFFAPRALLIYDCVTVPFLAVGYYFAAHSNGAVGVAWLSSASRVGKMIFMHAAAARVAARRGRRAADKPLPMPLAAVDATSGKV